MDIGCSLELAAGKAVEGLSLRRELLLGDLVLCSGLVFGKRGGMEADLEGISASCNL